MNSTINNHIKRTDYWAAGFMNINQVVCIRSNWFAEIKTGMMIGEHRPMRLPFTN